MSNRKFTPGQILRSISFISKKPPLKTDNHSRILTTKIIIENRYPSSLYPPNSKMKIDGIFININQTKKSISYWEF